MISVKYPLRVFCQLNHVPHQFEQLKMAKKYPVKFHYFMNNVRKWVAGPENDPPARPEPSTWLSKDQFEWVTAYEPGKYDVAILNVDQQHVNPDIGKGHLYKQLNATIQDIPKIVINHGTPNYAEMYEEDFVINGGEVQESQGKRYIPGMKELIGDNFMIVNSYEAVKRWGWGYPIIHGLDPKEWWDLPKEPRITISLSPGGLDDYYNRQLLSYIKTRVREKVGTDISHITVNYKAKSWDDYRFFLGSSLIYINPTKDSPMPRSRTEAMLSGCCVLTSKYHNADEFIQHGKNGFIVPDNPLSYAEALYQLLNYNYRECLEIGKKGRETAIKLFDINRYHKDVWEVLTGVANKKPPKWDGKKIW